MNYSLYVHIPFCKHRCHYCDFITYTGKEGWIPDYVDSVIAEIRSVAGYLTNNKVHSIYFGGGTPSLIPAREYHRIIESINQHYSILPNCEISLEANPGTISLAYLRNLRELGFNRLSMGMQSTDSFDLCRLDRIHSVDDVLMSYRHARLAGFDNINLDMIFSLPWQTLSSWENSLSRAIDLAPEHFALYSLIIEPGTLLYQWYQKGLIAAQNDDLEADMYESAMKMLEQAGYTHYEISNWAKEDTSRDFRCRHNLQYWFNAPFIGIGAGAHGYIEGIRTENISTIAEYIQHLKFSQSTGLEFPATPATIHMLEVDKATQMQDLMWLGLRLIEEGVQADRFYKTFGCMMTEVFKKEIDELLEQGLVKWGDNNKSRLILTRRGTMLANQVFMRFV